MPKEKIEKTKKKVVIVEEVQTPEEVQTSSEIPVPEEKVEVVETEAKQEVGEVKPQEEEPNDDYEKPNYLWIIVPTALLVGALVGGLITYFSGISNMSNTDSVVTPQPSVEPTVEETPTATPVSNLKKDTLTIQILNGSGVSGAAGKAKTLLEGLGYKNIDTGNASSSNVETTEVAIKEDKNEYLDLVIKDLSKDYEASEAAKPLSETSKYDIVVTIGKK